MVFDKTKAMRNAERYLAQGKIQNAIGEYKQVVANDPKDFGTLNMLGDLHTKNAEPTQAVRCYTSVAEHYAKQGFAQKAIAIYNKISKIQPNSLEITAQLADLYKQKGSINEARAHYKTVAEHYEREGRKLDALEIRKQIASLDPKDTEICLKLGEAYLAEDQRDDAAEAFSEAGVRLAKKSIHLEAIAAFERALELKPDDTNILTPFVQSHFACGTAAEAARKVSVICGENPLDPDVLNLLIDCQLEAGATADAERTVISLVEKDQASYPKFLDLARIYLKASDADSAARAMAMSAEHLLLAGQVDDFQVLLDEVLTLNPEQVEGLRLRARLFAWQRDEAGMYDALAKLATVAREKDSLDDERFALSQLVMIAPHQVEYADRLREINEQHGFDDAYSGDSMFDEQFMKAAKKSPVPEPELETFAAVPAGFAEVEEIVDEVSSADFAIVGGSVESPELSVEVVDTDDAEDEHSRLLREVDSIRFYIDSGYLELAGNQNVSGLNSFFGDSSGKSNTIGFQNSFFGGGTGFANVNGNYNSFFGYAAGFANTGGSENSFFGTYSGITNATGNSNSFFGFEAGRQNRIGNNNSFFGNRAGGNNDTGTANAFVGGFAGRLNSTGNSNSFLGASAGFNNSSGNSNLFVGASAGVINSTGSNNTVLGTNANLGANNLNNAGAIGFGALVTQSNSLILGGITGINSGSDTSVGIGTTAPLAKLHISRIEEGIRLQGKVVGNNNLAYMSFYDSAGNRVGYVGDGAFNDRGTFLVSDADDVALISPAGRVLTASFAGNVLMRGGPSVLGSSASFYAAQTIDTGNFKGLYTPNLFLNSLDTFLASPVHICARLESIGGSGGYALTRCTTSFSSANNKTAIQPFSDGLNIIRRLNPVSFKWKKDGSADVGLNAEDVADVAPTLVTRNSKGEIEDVREHSLNVVFINAIKEQQKQIETQQEQIRRQERQIDALTKLLCQSSPEAGICEEEK